MPESPLDILYDGWSRWRREVKGWSTCPSKPDIEDWEAFKNEIFTRIDERKNGNRA